MKSWVNRSTLRRLPWLWVLALLLTAGLAGCADSEDSSDAVTTFLNALVDQDRDKLFSVVCAEWEAGAALEFDAFQAVSAELDGVKCEATGEDGDDKLVTCEGKIVLDYNGELRDMSLENNTYRVQKEDGEWKVCGYE
jgi:hypothetical protein